MTNNPNSMKRALLGLLAIFTVATLNPSPATASNWGYNTDSGGVVGVGEAYALLGGAQQRGVAGAGPDRLGDLADRPGLVGGGAEGGVQAEGRHGDTRYRAAPTGPRRTWSPRPR